MPRWLDCEFRQCCKGALAPRHRSSCRILLHTMRRLHPRRSACGSTCGGEKGLLRAGKRCQDEDDAQLLCLLYTHGTRGLQLGGRPRPMLLGIPRHALQVAVCNMRARPWLARTYQLISAWHWNHRRLPCIDPLHSMQFARAPCRPLPHVLAALLGVVLLLTTSAGLEGAVPLTANKLLRNEAVEFDSGIKECAYPLGFGLAGTAGARLWEVGQESRSIDGVMYVAASGPAGTCWWGSSPEPATNCGSPTRPR